MSTYFARKSPTAHFLASPLAAILALALVLWATGLPLVLRSAHAAQLTLVSDTLSDSNLSALSRHVIAFTTSSGATAGQTIKIQFDPLTSLFSQSFSTATTTDITATGMTVVANVGACPGSGNNVYPTGNYNGGTDENITFTVCPSNAVTAGAKTITLGAGSTNLITNPSVASSYRILIGGSWADGGETRVAVLQNVTVTASVDTRFTFTVTGLANGSTINGTTTSTTTSATALQFETLTPGVPKFLGQELAVETNARNGFVVTVQENQPLTSATGATIDLFIDGASTTAPVIWTPPSNTLDQPWTYGHMGVTSDDTDLNSGEFTGTKFAGNIHNPRQVFSHTGPSDGLTQDKGKARVGYEIQIGTLQEAGTDYTNILTYVATPTF
ncbi:MAG: hypothetical protein RLZZ342_333 [Candidatus Parcubacteria bacterium]